MKPIFHQETGEMVQVILGLPFETNDLSRLNFREANLAGAALEGASLKDADLKRARLDYADLSRADLRGSDLRGASLFGARLDSVRLFNAVYDRNTNWPVGFRPQQFGARFIAEF